MSSYKDEVQSRRTPREGVQEDNGKSGGERNEPRPGDYTQFERLPPGGPLNRWSQVITRGHDFPGAQVSLFSLPPTSVLLLGTSRLREMRATPQLLDPAIGMRAARVGDALRGYPG
ncbi:hypothetical protein B0T24DRAFT_540608 [Lasiosphaeria ovina]|uniref:Uncharacterized protein n=1 Tax=Lasiosphaeria ovina TaxID=92902 RepID=A0AAE0MXG9_9PEZI|nr:hypothetical protein B0T24DRAFT_540608 [Lasiosphaeria ovina]